MSDKFNPEFSRIVKTDEMVSGKEKLVIEANEKERAALAERFELVSIDSLRAELESQNRVERRSHRAWPDER